MKNNTYQLDAITTLDGRYREKVENLSRYVSEKALIAVRFEIEVRYLLALSKEGIIRKLTKQEEVFLLRLVKDFSEEDAVRVKGIEEKTRHDVKAVEYLLREKLEKTTLRDVAEKAHLFLTSEDVNNLSQRINVKRALQNEIIPLLSKLMDMLAKKAEEYKGLPMLARTHGQSAVPTTVGKELAVFLARFEREMKKLTALQFTGKLSGAVGNYNSFRIADKKREYKDWSNFSKQFVEQFGLVQNHVTTQINTYEDIIEALQVLQRINGIGIDFAADCWRYISDGWFILEKVQGEVGSSTMPQKINPIDFENGEGNLSLSNDVIGGLVNRLPVSRLQRDLRDSTQMRNMGLILGWMVIGFSSIVKGFGKVAVEKIAVHDALYSDWSILSEGAQVWLRTHEDVQDPYALFKNITRGTKMTENEWKKAVVALPISDKAKKVFLALTPENYTGFAQEITGELLTKIKKSKNPR